MTPERACAALERRIIALFASERDAVGEELGAYLTVSSRSYVYVTFAGGIAKPQGAPVPVCADFDEAIAKTVDAVAAAFPGHADQMLVWRARVGHEAWGASAAPDWTWRYERPDHQAKATRHVRDL